MPLAEKPFMAVDVPCSCLSGDVSAMLRQAGRAAEGLRERQAKAMPDLLSVLMVAMSEGVAHLPEGVIFLSTLQSWCPSG